MSCFDTRRLVQLFEEEETLDAVSGRSLFRFVENVTIATTESDFLENFADFIASYGYTSVACVTFAPYAPITEDCILVNTRPQSWVSEYLLNGFLRCDPILQASTKSTHPFAWQDVLEKRELLPEHHRVMSHSADHSIYDGFVVPIFETTGRSAIISLAGPPTDLDSVARSRLTLASVYLHNRLAELRSRPRDDLFVLTDREREIMKWISCGKSDWQIGQILNISQKTVNYHVENTKRKFGVATRIQAVVAALRHGFLDVG